MDIKAFYEEIGGNYEAAKARLVTDERIEKYLKRFPSYVKTEELKTAVEAGDHAAVFAITHDMKGMCLNLELSPLAKSSSALCEAVRGGAPAVDIAPLFSALERDLQLVLTALSAFGCD